MRKRTLMASTPVEWEEEVVEYVGEWGAEYIERQIKLLMPDGRAFMQDKLTAKEEEELYQRELRGKPDAWRAWIDTRTQEMITQLQQMGLDDEAIKSAHPYDTVEAAAIAYSARMERRLQKSEAQREPLRPDALPAPTEGVSDDLPGYPA